MISMHLIQYDWKAIEQLFLPYTNHSILMFLWWYFNIIIIIIILLENMVMLSITNVIQYLLWSNWPFMNRCCPTGISQTSDVRIRFWLNIIAWDDGPECWLSLVLVFLPALEGRWVVKKKRKWIFGYWRVKNSIFSRTTHLFLNLVQKSRSKAKLNKHLIQAQNNIFMQFLSYIKI